MCPQPWCGLNPRIIKIFLLNKIKSCHGSKTYRILGKRRTNTNRNETYGVKTNNDLLRWKHMEAYKELD